MITKGDFRPTQSGKSTKIAKSTKVPKRPQIILVDNLNIALKTLNQQINWVFKHSENISLDRKDLIRLADKVQAPYDPKRIRSTQTLFEQHFWDMCRPIVALGNAKSLEMLMPVLGQAAGRESKFDIVEDEGDHYDTDSNNVRKIYKRDNYIKVFSPYTHTLTISTATPGRCALRDTCFDDINYIPDEDIEGYYGIKNINYIDTSQDDINSLFEGNITNTIKDYMYKLFNNPNKKESMLIKIKYYTDDHFKTAINIMREFETSEPYMIAMICTDKAMPGSLGYTIFATGGRNRWERHTSKEKSIESVYNFAIDSGINKVIHLGQKSTSRTASFSISGFECLTGIYDRNANDHNIIQDIGRWTGYTGQSEILITEKQKKLIESSYTSEQLFIEQLITNPTDPAKRQKEIEKLTFPKNSKPSMVNGCKFQKSQYGEIQNEQQFLTQYENGIIVSKLKKILPLSVKLIKHVKERESEAFERRRYWKLEKLVKKVIGSYSQLVIMKEQVGEYELERNTIGNWTFKETDQPKFYGYVDIIKKQFTIYEMCNSPTQDKITGFHNPKDGTLFIKYNGIIKQIKQEKVYD